MKRPAVIFFALFVSVDFAHAARHRVVEIVGTTVFIDQASIAVRKLDGGLRTAILNDSSMFLKDDSPTLFKYIHTGDPVVIHATR